MRSLESLVGRALDLASSRRAECEVWVERRAATQSRTGGGSSDVRHLAQRDTLTVTVTIWRDGHEGCAVAEGADSIPQAVDAALALGGMLPRRDRVMRGFSGLTSDADAAGTGRPSERDLIRLGALSARSHLVRDVALDTYTAVTAFGESGGGYGARRSSRAAIQARFATGTNNGALTRSFAGATPEAELAAAENAWDECLRQATTLGEPIANWTPRDAVVLDGSVMSQLLPLLAPSVQLDSVAEGKSRLAGRLDERIASPGFRLVDDAPGRSAPVAFGFDDEGTPTRVIEVVADGWLRAFLSDARTAAAHGTASTGAGWRAPAGGEVRVRPRALIAGWDDTAAPCRSGAELHVLQATGMHISNDVTGDFSFGAVGVLDDGSGALRNAGSFTMAGNVVDMLDHVWPVESPVRHVASGDGLYGSPDIGISGLVVGK